MDGYGRSEGVEARTSAEGSSRIKREPAGELSSTRRPPPCSATIRAAMASPRPVPRSFVEKTLWPEYLALQEALQSYLNEATERIIREEVYGDAGEAAERVG